MTCAISDRRPMLRVVLIRERLRGGSAGGQAPAGLAAARPGAGRHEQGLGVEICEADRGQVGEALDADVAAPPFRAELPGEREAPLRLAAPPRGRDVLELGLQRRRDLVCRNYAERVPRLPEPGDGLAHLADRTSLERELARVEHGLLPDRHGLEPERAIALEMRVGGADDREPPAARAGDPAQLREEGVDLRLVADRIAADEGRSRDDAGGEQGAARRREEIALVAAQGA